MNHCTIKGRGKNRGKYLGYESANGGPGTGYVWVDKQRNAGRWDHPRNRSGGWGYVNDLAEKFNGYFVRIVANASVVARIHELNQFIAAHANGAKDRLDCYWLDGDWSGDEGPNYCWECATKLVDAAFAKDPKQFADLYGDRGGNRNCAEDYYDDAISGGYSMDHDSPPYCEANGCCKSLNGTLTDHGADEELSVLTGNDAPTFDDAESWYMLDIALMNLSDKDPRWNKIAKIVDAAAAQERRAKPSELPALAETQLQ